MIAHTTDSKSSISQAGFVLTGGKSSRMGADKAFLPFRGKPMLEHTLNIVSRVCSSVVIVGEVAKFGRFGTVVEDVFAGCGPLAGIHAGLISSAAELNLFLGVDMPFVSEELLAFLFSVAEQSEATVIVPKTTRLQPLCGVYRRSFAGIAERALQAGKYKVDAAFAGVPVRVIDAQELTKAGFSEQHFFNVNSPAELEAAEKFPSSGLSTGGFS